MSSSDPKMPKLNGVFELNINTNTNQNNLQSSKDESKPPNSGLNPPQVSEGNISTTMSLFPPQEYQDTLNSSNITILSPPPEVYPVYSYSKDYYYELYQNLIFEEQRLFAKINCQYMNFQSNINSNMRAILVDWLIYIHDKCNMKKKTLFQCVYIIDAYLSKNQISIVNLQLLGIASALIASKTNEVIYPKLKSFLAFTNNAYNLEELNNMELEVMKKLEFDILAPTADEFFAINADIFEFTKKQRFFGEYFLDTSLIDFATLKYKPSTIALACNYIVIKFFNININDLIAQNVYQNINPNEVIDCARYLFNLNKYLSQSTLVAIKNKYSTDKYMNIAQINFNNFEI